MNLIFAHIGNRAPKHLWANMMLCRERFSSEQIFFVSDCQEDLNLAERIGLHTHRYSPSDSDLELVNNSAKDWAFRNGFWHYSLLRLFGVLQLISEKELGASLHVESDVLLLPRFPFDKFSGIKQAKWTTFNQDRDVAALFFVPDHKVAEKLSQELRRELMVNPDHTDMTMLSHIAKNGSHINCHLPSNLDESSNLLELDNGSGAESQAIFGGVFDGAILGMWILGQDPHNHKGFVRRGIFLEDGAINPSNRKFFVSNGALLCKTDNLTTEIYNLHVHSKELRYFSSSSMKQIALRCYLNQFSIFRISFSPRVFSLLLTRAIKRRI